jgi:hypothetical protein
LWQGRYVAKLAKTKSELEAMILKQARVLGLYSMVRGVTVRSLRRKIAGANWIVIPLNRGRVAPHLRRKALRQILPPIREKFDLAEID